VQPLRALCDLRVGIRGVHSGDVQVMHGVIAEIMPPAQDPLRDLRVLPEPGPDGEPRDPRSRTRCLGKQGISHRFWSLTVEGERHLGPAP